MLVTGDELIRREPNGSSVQHADLSDLAPFWNDVVVDGRGNVYLNSINFRYVAGAEVTPGLIALVTPDRTARKVAGDLTFPNGMVITPDNSTLLIGESMAGRVTAFDIAEDGSLSNRRVWAEGLGPDGITMDTDGALWVQTPDHPRGSIVRMREGGETLARIDHDRSILAAMLGGPDGTTLFLLAVEWRGLGKVEETIAARTGQVLVAQAPAPRAGWP